MKDFVIASQKLAYQLHIYFAIQMTLDNVIHMYLSFYLFVHPRLDLVNVIVRPFLFTKLSLFTKSSLDKE